MSEPCRVLITGSSILCSLGDSVDDVWGNLLEERLNISKEAVELSDNLKLDYYINRLKDFEFSKYLFDSGSLEQIMLWKKGEISKDLLYLLSLAGMCLRDSKINTNAANRKIGLILTCEGPGLEDFFSKIIEFSYAINQKSNLSKKEYTESIYLECAKAGYDLQTFMHLFFINFYHKLTGFSIYLNNACSSGLFAMETAASLIRNHTCDCVLVVGGDHAMNFKYRWFHDLGIYAKDGLIKPFCVDSKGYVFGDGGGAVMMESEHSALSRAAIVKGEYAGGGFFNQNWKVTLPNINLTTYSDAIRLALSRSCVSADQIDLVCSHGVGLRLTDKYESDAIRNVFSDFATPVCALKPYFGHNLGGSGLLEIVVLLKLFLNNVIPRVLNTDQFDENMGINLVRAKGYHKTVNTIMKISTSFAGFDSAVVLKKYE